MSDELDQYLKGWDLLPDGEPFATFSGVLQPVRLSGAKCMLKVARREKDRRAGELLVWWNGEGAVKVLAHDRNAILMERATGASSLAAMATGGRDDEATGILCDVIQRLHSRKPPYPEQLIPLDRWFADLPVAARKYGGVFIECASVAEGLINSQQEIVPLHGDIHHGNVLDFGDLGWQAIDPKGLIGERGFDYANIFCNPDPFAATRPGRLLRQVFIAADAALLDKVRLLQWIVAWAGLSAAWCIQDKQEPEHALKVATLALAALGR